MTLTPAAVDDHMPPTSPDMAPSHRRWGGGGPSHRRARNGPRVGELVVATIAECGSVPTSTRFPLVAMAPIRREINCKNGERDNTPTHNTRAEFKQSFPLAASHTHHDSAYQDYGEDEVAPPSKSHVSHDAVGVGGRTWDTSHRNTPFTEVTALEKTNSSFRTCRQAASTEWWFATSLSVPYERDAGHGLVAGDTIPP
jgi:hypothetical protein